MFYLIKKHQHFLKNGIVLILSILIATNISAQRNSQIWFVKAGAKGDGSTVESPLGSTTILETVSGPSDLIILLPGEGPLDGGLALKKGQTLIGLPQAGQQPIITNTDTVRNDGNGLVLAGDNRIWNIRIEDTYASGIIGINVSGNRIEGVAVYGANQSGTFTAVNPPPTENPPHGGILFLNSPTGLSVENYITNAEVIDATAVGIASVASVNTQSRLVIHNTRVEKGKELNRLDIGIVGVAGGPGAESHLEIDKCVVQGRTSLGGRNIMVFAANDAKATAVIERSTLGAVGQDGILATASFIPAEVSVDIRECLIENASQMNVEGTISNQMVIDPARAEDTKVSINIENSIIRNAGVGERFELDTLGITGNIWMGTTDMAQQIDPTSTAPFPPGSFQLTLRNCQVSEGKEYGIGFGNYRLDLPPEKASFKVLLQGNKIMNNGPAEIMIAAPGTRIDARGNCWGTKAGLSQNKIRLLGAAKLDHLDASNPIPCEE